MGLKLTGGLPVRRVREAAGPRHSPVLPGRRRRRRHRAAEPGHVGVPGRASKPRGLRHTCGNRGDFKTRKRKAATAERRRKRKAAAARRAGQAQAGRRRAAGPRPSPQAGAQGAGRAAAPARRRHEPGTCGNRDCPKYGCKAYWQGMADCPGPHEGE